MRAPRRPRRWASARTLCALALVALGVQALVAGSRAGAATCLNDTEQGDRWHRIPGPPGVQVVSLDQFDDDPCDLVATDGSAVWISGDGGATWTQTYRRPNARRIVRVFLEGIGSRTVVLALAPEVPVDGAGRSDTGLLVSTDAGLSFGDANAPGMASMDVLALTSEPSAGRTGRQLYVVTRARLGRLPGPAEGARVGPSVYTGSTGGLAPQPASQAFAPTAVAVDPAAIGQVWVNDVPAQAGSTSQLWHSVDSGQAWSRVGVPAPGTVRDLTFSGSGGAASALLVAGDFGLLRSVDGARTWQLVHSGSAMTAVRAEANHPLVVTGIVNGKPYRGVMPNPLQPVTAGLPATCQAAGLSRTAPLTGGATFLVSCGSTGFYRYRSGGADLQPAPAQPPVPPNPVVPPLLPPTPPAAPTPSNAPGNLPVAMPMVPLRTVDFPSVDGLSASIAFDGEILYYTDGQASAKWSDEHAVIRRVRAATGLPLPDLVVKLGRLPSPSDKDWLAVFADPRRRVLYLETERGTTVVNGRRPTRMLQYDLASGEVSYLFEVKRDLSYSEGWDFQQLNFDLSLDQFAAGDELGQGLRHLDRQGAAADDGCRHTFGGPRHMSNITTTVLGAGDGGGAYIEMEDDSTLIRVDRTCRVLAVYAHRTVSEASIENDQMACDTVTFGVPALWIRDALVKTATAYAIPFGYCYPSLVPPLPARPVPGGALPPPAPQPQPVPQPQPQPQPGPAQQPAPQVQVQQQPVPQAQAQAQAQGQQQAQQQVQQQAQQQVQPGLAAQRQQQPQVAGVQVSARQQEQYAMTRRRRPVPPVAAGAAFVMAMAYGVALGRRWRLAGAVSG